MPRGQKAGRAVRLHTPLGYSNSLTTFRQRGSLGSEEVFASDMFRNGAEGKG